MNAVLRIHDRITYVLFAIGVILIALIGVLYVYEVASRYFLNAPTDWGNDTSSFMLSVATFLCIPQLVKDGGHVAVTIIFQYSTPAVALWVARITAIAGAIVCAIAAYMAFEEAVAADRQRHPDQHHDRDPEMVGDVVHPLRARQRLDLFRAHAQPHTPGRDLIRRWSGMSS